MKHSTQLYYRRSCVVTMDNMKLRLQIWKSGGHYANSTTSEVVCTATVWVEGIPPQLTQKGYLSFGHKNLGHLFSSMPDKGMLKLKAMAMAQRLPKFPFSRSMSIQAYIDLVSKTDLEISHWARAIKGEL